MKLLTYGNQLLIFLGSILMYLIIEKISIYKVLYIIR
jgi:hypothetical protein